jgi:hypothetical protein
MADQHKLGFPLLSDAGNQVARQFGLVYRVPEYQQAVFRRAFISLPFVNGDDSWELPIAATYILECDRTVVYAAVDEDYRNRPEPMDILQTSSALTRAPDPKGGVRAVLRKRSTKRHFLSILQANFQLASGFIDGTDRIDAMAMEVMARTFQVSFGLVQGFQGLVNFRMRFECGRRHGQH